jgi:hypothetical protein
VVHGGKWSLSDLTAQEWAVCAPVKADVDDPPGEGLRV